VCACRYMNASHFKTRSHLLHLLLKVLDNVFRHLFQLLFYALFHPENTQAQSSSPGMSKPCTVMKLANTDVGLAGSEAHTVYGNLPKGSPPRNHSACIQGWPIRYNVRLANAMQCTIQCKAGQYNTM